jgi:hypothetical protein
MDERLVALCQVHAKSSSARVVVLVWCMISTILCCVFVGVLWGSTNPFIRRGSLKCQEKAAVSGQEAGWRCMLSTPALVVPQALNYTGSLLFVVLLGSSNISVAVPLANGISLLVNAAVDLGLGEQYHLSRLAVGTLCTIAGATLCARGCTQ